MMNKEIVKKLIENKSVSKGELFQFIVDYCEFKKKPTPTSEQLENIIQLISMGVFNLTDALDQSAKELNMQINKLYDKNGVLIKIDIYE